MPPPSKNSGRPSASNGDIKHSPTPTVFFAGSLSAPASASKFSSSYNRKLTEAQKAYLSSSRIASRLASVETAKKRLARTKDRFDSGEHQLRGWLKVDEKLLLEAERRLEEIKRQSAAP